MMEYQRIVYGFHGCTESTKELILREGFKPSTNKYDWLGHGIYFWEDNEERAWEWAEELCKDLKGERPAVLCAKIDLGNCLDLMQDSSMKKLRKAYDILLEKYNDIPQNKNVIGNRDWKLRMRDCMVINYFCNSNQLRENTPYDTVRSAFQEGTPIYPGSGFRDKTHIQLAVRNPECILEIIDVTH